ncbi:MAG: hypothetical protein ACT4OY_08195 [Alphaproteobacteria bacterium]
MVSTPAKEPRSIDLKLTFNNLVQWIKTMAVERNTPGLIVGISGTDSGLT